MTTQKKNVICIAVIVGSILLVPLIAIQFTDEVDWSLGDFVTMGTLLFIMGFVIDFVARKITRPLYRVLGIIIIILVFLFIWVELAVGVLATPFAGS